MPSPNDPVCANCTFHKEGKCHRYPPMAMNPVDLTSAWPAVDPDDTCGEFKKASD